MITNIDIDEAIVAEAMRISGARTKREVVDRALREMVARARRPKLRELFGRSDLLEPGYDHKVARGVGPTVPVFQEPPGSYQVARAKPARGVAAAKKLARR